MNMKVKSKLILKNAAAEIYLEWYPEAEIKKAFRKGSRAQRDWDEFLIDEFEPYVPIETKMLMHSVTIATAIGSGEIIYHTPYSKYLYYGKVMVDPKTKVAGFETDDGWKSRKGVAKILTNRELEYSKAVNKNAGPFWDMNAEVDRIEKWKKFLAGIIVQEFGGE